jgi:hypothetical protein
VCVEGKQRPPGEGGVCVAGCARRWHVCVALSAPGVLCDVRGRSVPPPLSVMTLDDAAGSFRCAGRCTVLTVVVWAVANFCCNIASHLCGARCGFQTLHTCTSCTWGGEEVVLLDSFSQAWPAGPTHVGKSYRRDVLHQPENRGRKGGKATSDRGRRQNVV